MLCSTHGRSSFAFLASQGFQLIGILDIVIPDATGNVVTTQPLTTCQNGPGNAIEKRFDFGGDNVRGVTARGRCGGSSSGWLVVRPTKSTLSTPPKPRASSHQARSQVASPRTLVSGPPTLLMNNTPFSLEAKRSRHSPFCDTVSQNRRRPMKTLGENRFNPPTSLPKSA